VFLGALLSATVPLALIVAVLRLYSRQIGIPVTSFDDWFVWTAILALGVLPLPGLFALCKAALWPRKPRTLVESTSVGTAAVALTALNEEQAIERVVRDFIAAPGVGRVIVIDNGSRDRTPDLASAAGAQVVREERPGYGNACIRALAEGLRSTHPVIVLCEADCTFRAEDIGKLTLYLRNTDLVIGSRTHAALINGQSQLDSFFILGNVFIGKLLQLRYWDWITGGAVRLTGVGCT